MKKQIAILSFVFLIATLVWVILAQKFESLARETLIPKMQEYHEIVSFNPDSVKIDKYKFRINLEDVKIKLPGNSSFWFDKIAVLSNPFTPNIFIKTIGQKATLNSKNDFDNIYYKDPSFYLEFDKALLDGNFEDFEVIFGSINDQSYDAGSDLLLSSAKGSKTSLKIKKFRDTENYIINIDTDSAKLFITPELLKKTHANLDKEKKNLDPIMANQLEPMNGYMISILDLIFDEHNSPIDTNIGLELILSKDLIDAFMKSISTSDSEALIRFVLMNPNLFSKDILDVRMNVNYQDSSTTHSIVSNFTNTDNGKFVINFVAKNNNDYGTKQEKAPYVANLWSNVLYNIYNLIFNNKGSSHLEIADFLPIGKLLTEIKNSHFNFAVKYTSGEDINYVLKAGVNQYNMELNGDSSGKERKVQVQMTNPKSFILSLVETSENVIIPFIENIIAKEKSDDRSILNQIKDLTSAIKVNGVDIMKMFNSKKDLAEGEAFVSNIIMNNEDNQVSVNGKPYSDFEKNDLMINFIKTITPKEAKQNTRKPDVK